jgi:integrase
VRTRGLESVTPHALRHTYAARLIARKDALGNSDSVNPKLLSYLMGHATVGFTLEVYGGLYPEDVSGGVLDEENAIAL